jgi:hypothetical protein
VIQRTDSVPLRLETTGEDIEIVSPDGRSEVRVSFGPDGPVVTVIGGRVRLEAEDLRLRLGKLAIETAGELRLRAGGDVHVDGKVVRLNCTAELPPVALDCTETGGQG